MSSLVDTLYANLDAEPDSWQCRVALIEALLIEHRPEEAMALIARIPGLPGDLDERVFAARALGLIEPADGLPLLDEILRESPAHPGAHFEKAFLSHRAGDIETARVHYHRAIALDPVFKDARFESKLGAAATQGDQDSVADEITEEKEEKFFPGPGEIPVITLRQAMAAQGTRKPADLRSNPPPVILNYSREAKSRPLAFTRAPEFLRRIRKLRIQPRAGQAPVEYDSRQPDESLFARPLSPDRILVGAPVTEDGVPVATLQESLQRRRMLRDPAIEKRIRRNKAQSISIGAIAVLGLAALMTLISLGVARIRPPQIVAQTASRIEESLENREIVRQRSRHQPVSDPSAMLSTDFLKSAAVSAVGFPSLEAPGKGLGLSDLGAYFGAGMNFASSSTQFFGTRVQGKMAVVFDVTGSMYTSIPIVVREIENRFRNAHVVAVHGSLFTDQGPRELIPYEQNRNLQEMVGGFSIFSGTSNDLDRALRGLRRCDSMEFNPDTGYLQSLGRAIELLIAKKSAQTIFVFSDFQDGEEKAYLRKIAGLARGSRVKVVFHHPIAFEDRVTRRAYEAFAKESGGEVKEGGLEVGRRQG